MSAARTERLLNLLTLLLNSRRPISLRELREMEEFRAYCSVDPKTGERAFERDKASLVELGVPLRWIPPEHADDEDGAGAGLAPIGSCLKKLPRKRLRHGLEVGGMIGGIERLALTTQHDFSDRVSLPAKMKCQWPLAIA